MNRGEVSLRYLETRDLSSANIFHEPSSRPIQPNSPAESNGQATKSMKHKPVPLSKAIATGQCASDLPLPPLLTLAGIPVEILEQSHALDANPCRAITRPKRVPNSNTPVSSTRCVANGLARTWYRGANSK